LEIGYSARSGPDLRTGLRQPPVSAMPVVHLTPAIEDRAVEVLTLLVDRGQHRAPSIPDLLISATAEFAGLTILHCDKDFDLIVAVTGQAAERCLEARLTSRRSRAGTRAIVSELPGRPSASAGPPPITSVTARSPPSAT
jgi:hypothetical protein